MAFFDSVINELNGFDKRKTDYYAILGCDELSTKEQILSEYRVRALACHPDKNPDLQGCSGSGDEAFQLLSRAKEVLINVRLRSNYDQWKRCGLSVPFEDWLAGGASSLATHWTCEGPKKAMLTNAAESANEKVQNSSPLKSNGGFVWQREEADVLSRFRSYEL